MLGSTRHTARRPGRQPWILSAAALPLAAPYGAALAYRLFHPPHRRHHRLPADFGLTATELKIPFGAGRHLHCWLCPAEPDRVVVLGHGIGLSKSGSLAHAKFLHDAGYTVCLFDHRNHGASDRDRAWTGLSTRFTADITLVVSHLRGMPAYASARFAVYGFSFSTFPSLDSLTHDGFDVDAIICDSGPALDIPPLFGNFVAADGLPIPALLRGRPARSAVTGVLRSLGTAMLRATWPPPPEGLYGHIPLLFLTGGRDRLVPAAQVQALAAHYRLAETTVLPEAEHLTGLKTDPETYTNTVLDFLKRTLA